ncbi:hypothetical protein [Lentibacillus sp. Marseille-P4043]|nr:hypothetical protein [Lentibacillus sp. Marseille-P4043]
MLKIVHPICCGINVHKKFVVATVGTTNRGLQSTKPSNSRLLQKI